MTQTVNVVITSAALEWEKENVSEKRDSELGTGAVESGERWWVSVSVDGYALGSEREAVSHPVIQSSPSRSTVALPFYLLPFSAASPLLGLGVV